jgi:sialic acid synthase SpsE
MLCKNPIIILECANSHGGSKKNFLKLINKFSNLDYSNLHIKFQPFKYDEISTFDYNWYKVYKKLYFKKSFWSNVIRKSSKLYKGVWIDIFDRYGLDVLKENISKIYGIKIQSSVIQNEKIYNELKNFNHQKLSLIINISGYNLYEIKNLLVKYQKLEFKLIILQYGFQSYPTKVSNLNLNKINYLKKKFNLKNISFADHTDSRDDFSLYFPSILLSKNCHIIEKHIGLHGNNSKYDGCSSLNFIQSKKFIDFFKKTLLSLENNRFISNEEKKYLRSTLQKPVFSKNLPKGKILELDDIEFKRTNQSLRFVQNIKQKVNKYIIALNVKKNDLVKTICLKKK